MFGCVDDVVWLQDFDNMNTTLFIGTSRSIFKDVYCQLCFLGQWKQFGFELVADNKNFPFLGTIIFQSDKYCASIN